MPAQPADHEIAGPGPLLTPSVSFPCGSCGGHGAWHAARQDVVCDSCGQVLDLPPPRPGAAHWFDVVPLLRDRPDSGRTWQAVATSVRCLACHGVTRLRAGVAAAKCETCGATSLVVVDQLGAPIAPAGAVPFQVSESDARDAVRAWVTEHARRDFGRGASAPIDVRAVYLPWWDFLAHVHCPWRMEADHRRPDGTVTRIVKGGTVELDLDETLPAVRSAPDDLLDMAGPFDLQEARPYEARYLAGATVEQYSVNLWDGWDAAHARMQARLEKALRLAAGTRFALPSEMWPTWTGESARMILVPVFLGTFGTAAGPSPVVVNGVTGKVGALWPWSVAARIHAGIVLTAVAAVAVALVWGAWTLLKASGFRPPW